MRAVVAPDDVRAQPLAVVLAGVEDAAVGPPAVPDQPARWAAVDVLAEAVVQELALQADLCQLVGLSPAELAPEDQPTGHTASVARASAGERRRLALAGARASAATSPGRAGERRHFTGPNRPRMLGSFGPRRARSSLRAPRLSACCRDGQAEPPAAEVPLRAARLRPARPRARRARRGRPHPRGRALRPPDRRRPLAPLPALRQLAALPRTGRPGAPRASATGSDRAPDPRSPAARQDHPAADRGRPGASLRRPRPALDRSLPARRPRGAASRHVLPRARRHPRRRSAARRTAPTAASSTSSTACSTRAAERCTWSALRSPPTPCSRASRRSGSGFRSAGPST